MKLLFLHSDFLEFEAKKPALRNPPTLTDAEKQGRVEDALVVMYSVEKSDEVDVDGAVAAALRNVKDVAAQLKAEKVVLYPYAHLSNSLASPSKAVLVGEKLKKLTSEAGFQVTTAPFGWYKMFNIKVKGHPLAELSRSIGPDEVRVAAEAKPAEGEAAGEARESEALKKEKKLVSHWYVLTPEGALTPADEFDFSPYPELDAFQKHERFGTRATMGQEPPHVKMMREMELVDYEPGSDPGNFRWYPKGSLVKRLLETRVSDLVAGAGGMRVETPIMYDYEHPALAKYLNRFPARQYVLKSEEKEYFLRFAACFGQYLIMHDATISYRHLPMRIYELTHYSFRREKTGELSGLRRLRTFTMPDMHTVVGDMEQAKKEFLEQFKLSMQWMEDINTPYNAGVRFVRSFFDENREFAVGLAKLLGRPILIEMWDERFFYFVMKFEFNVNDTQGKAAALSTVQIDVENGERFGIQYVNEAGERKHPLILHASLSGSIDRNVYALLETEARKVAAGGKGTLPFWLSPTQVRFLPVSDAYVGACLEMAQRLAAVGIRVDVDDRDQGVGRKIRDAEREWVPLSVVYGEKEAASGMLPVRERYDGKQTDLKLSELEDHARHLQAGRPTAPLPLPTRLSLRPIFRG
ncbi:MAG TPA: threonine--tRNA ligase [Candidatus Thermoplasmatota archaeon]|nr:threonine--tRNA ligase [Candidatus Thermoplasmatota archaeon]